MNRIIKNEISVSKKIESAKAMVIFVNQLFRRFV
jgi:hypothetical protein